jgi:hypothetical protein
MLIYFARTLSNQAYIGVPCELFNNSYRALAQALGLLLMELVEVIDWVDCLIFFGSCGPHEPCWLLRGWASGPTLVTGNGLVTITPCAVT